MELVNRLARFFFERDSLIVAFSGGVDSAVLVVVAHRALGERMLAVTGDSPSVPSRDRELTVTFCAAHGIPHQFVATKEFDNPDYRANAGNRCYFCKEELFRQLESLRVAKAFDWIAEGTNRSDLSGHRPGQKAATEAERVISPYLDLGIDKAGVRAIARELRLELAEKPATACLASRIPVGTAVDPEVLRRIDAAENVLRDLGFEQLRVRHHGALVRIEVPAAELMACVEKRERIVTRLRELGFKQVTLDLQGYRIGGGVDG
ncbi:MAG: ATP-dependent sacrificial sulfur transferase LarE [Deltaproteobacteria bacterium]|nr:ATP-dependent sacrificial sulfur transferase LarE [Deltaproteobacteria bacterium]